MARRPRLQFPGAIFHVMARGVRKAAIFEDDIDRQRFMSILGQTARRYGVRFYSVCLMTNHYHLVLDTPRGNLSDAMRFLNGVFAQACNRRHARTGHHFEARFRSIVVQRKSYLKVVTRYVVINQVRAKLAANAASCQWTTYTATAGQTEPPEWLYLDWLEWAFPADTRAESQRRYREYVNAPAAQRTRVDTAAVALGSKAFRDRMAQLVKEAQADRTIPLTCAVAEKPPLSVLFADSDGCPISRAEGVFVAHVIHGYRLQEIANYLGVHRSTASRLLASLRDQ